MKTLYQIFNFQHDKVKTVDALEQAMAEVYALRQQFTDEGFYVVELDVVYSSYPAHMKP